MEIKILFRWLIPIAKLVWAIWFIGLAFVIFLPLYDYCEVLATTQQDKPMAALVLYALPGYCLVSMLVVAGLLIYRTVLSMGRREAEKEPEGKDEG